MVRRVRPQSVLATFAALFAAACADRIPTTPASGPSEAPSLGFVAPGSTSAPGRYLVGYTSPTATVPASVLAAAGGRVVATLPHINVVVVDGVTNPTALQQGASFVEAEFEALTGVQVFASDPTDGALAQPNPPSAAWTASHVQWDLQAIHAIEAWPITSQGAGVKVCIVDTGVDDQHQELNGGKVLLRQNFVTAGLSNTTPADILPTTVQDLNGHGSHVAGEAAGRGVVTAGVAPDASVLSARVLNKAGSGKESDIIIGIKWCADQGAHVINVSIGGRRFLGLPGFATAAQAYTLGIQYAADRGSLVVVSAGNDNLQLPNPGGAQITLPAQAPGALSVGATGPFTKIPRLAVPNWNPFDPAQVWQSPDGKSFYSNYGTAVGVFAPGGVGSAPTSYVNWIVNRVIQGSSLDNIYGVCASTTTQTGVANNGGVPTAIAPTSCSGRTDRYIAYAGTSMASPHVAGMAALLYGEIGGAPTAANRARVLNCIKTTTDNIGPATIFGGGRVNVKKAVDALKAGTC